MKLLPALALSLLTQSCNETADNADASRLDSAETDASFDDVGAGDARADQTTRDVGAEASNACPDAGGFFGPPRCDCGNFLLCDDFEAPALDPNFWNIDDRQGSHAITTEKFARGSHALALHVSPRAGARALVSERATFPAPNNNFWVRFFVFVAPKSPQAHVGLVSAAGPGSAGTIEERIGTQYGQLRPNYMAPNAEYGIFNSMPPTQLPIETWSCFEVHYDGGHNEMRTFLGEQELVEIAVPSAHTPTWTAPLYNVLTLGPILYGDDSVTSPGGFDYWFDSVAVATTRIGCYL
jgi:hypothetical protein